MQSLQISVDAGYFLKRFTGVYPDRDAEDAVIVARSLQLKCLRKVALRLGRLQDLRGWRMRSERLHALLRKQIDFSDLTDDDFVYDVKQKGTDMRVGQTIYMSTWMDCAQHARDPRANKQQSNHCTARPPHFFCARTGLHTVVAPSGKLTE